MSTITTSAHARRHLGALTPSHGHEGAEALVARASRLAARVVDAPFGALMLGHGEVVQVAGNNTYSEEWLRASPGLTQDIACILQGSRRPDPVSGDDRVESFATQPVLLSDGTAIGHLGAFDVAVRTWGPIERSALSDLAGLVASEVEARLAAHATADVRHVGRHLGRELSHLDTALTGLLEHAERHDDVDLQHRAAAVRARAAEVRHRQDHLNAVVPQKSADHRFDVGHLVQGIVDDVAARTHGDRVRLTVEPFSLPVQTDEEATRAALTSALRHLVSQFGPHAIRVSVHRRDRAFHDLAGSMSVEVEIAAGGGLSAGDLARMGSSLSGARTTGGLHLAVDGDTVHLTGPGVDARTSGVETHVTVAWPLDLG